MIMVSIDPYSNSNCSILMMQTESKHNSVLIIIGMIVCQYLTDN